MFKGFALVSLSEAAEQYNAGPSPGAKRQMVKPRAHEIYNCGNMIKQTGSTRKGSASKGYDPTRNNRQGVRSLAPS